LKTPFAIALLSLSALAALPGAGAHMIDPLFPKCQTVYDFPDEGLVVCVDPADDDCPVYGYHTTFLGTEKECFVHGAQWASSASVDCFPVYSRTDVGTISIVRRNSCSPPEVYQCPYEGAPLDQCTNVLEVRSASSSEPMCLYYYSEVGVGPVRHVQRDSCHSENYVCNVPVADYLASEPDPAALAQCTTDSFGALA
jgi:hypothetical protein